MESSLNADRNICSLIVVCVNWNLSTLFWLNKEIFYKILSQLYGVIMQNSGRFYYFTFVFIINKCVDVCVKSNLWFAEMLWITKALKKLNSWFSPWRWHKIFSLWNLRNFISWIISLKSVGGPKVIFNYKFFTSIYIYIFRFFLFTTYLSD